MLDQLPSVKTATPRDAVAAASAPTPLLAKACEERGFDSFWVPEHTHIPVSRLSPFPGGGELAKEYSHLNDPFVMQAWGRTLNVPDGLQLVSDGNADLTRALGMEMDASGYGMGIRARRFALYAEDGVVRHLFVEAPGEFRVSSAEYVLAALD